MKDLSQRIDLSQYNLDPAGLPDPTTVISNPHPVEESGPFIMEDSLNNGAPVHDYSMAAILPSGNLSNYVQKE